MTEQHAKIWMDPTSLPFLEFREKYKDKADCKDVAYEMLRNFCLPFPGCDPIQLVIERAEISDGYDFLKVVPADDLIVERIIEPLRVARICYCLGHYGASIAMAGTACEMAALFIHELLDKEKASSWTGQGQRLKQLKAFAEVPKDFLDNADFVREERNKYMHVLETDNLWAEHNSHDVLWAALKAIDSLFSLKPTEQPGALGMSSGLIQEYLKEQGVITDVVT
ncbi:hypothetical protein KA183_21180 [bacterium]|nr:hypothetical protein [bacterium]